METKLEVDEMKRVQHEIGMVQGIAVPRVGKSGGLALLWKFDMKVLVKFINRWYIDALIDSGSEIGIWRLIGFYGNPKTHKRIGSWEVLTRLGQLFDKLWVCIGDFNEVRASMKRKEGLKDLVDRLQTLGNVWTKRLGFYWFMVHLGS